MNARVQTAFEKIEMLSECFSKATYKANKRLSTNFDWTSQNAFTSSRLILGLDWSTRDYSGSCHEYAYASYIMFHLS